MTASSKAAGLLRRGSCSPDARDSVGEPSLGIVAVDLGDLNQSTPAAWRRDRDSNPGDGFPPTRVPGVRLRPLGHLSVEAAYSVGIGNDNPAGD